MSRKQKVALAFAIVATAAWGISDPVGAGHTVHTGLERLGTYAHNVPVFAKTVFG